MTGSAVDRAAAVLAEHRRAPVSSLCRCAGDVFRPRWGEDHQAEELAAAGLLPAALPVDRADDDLEPWPFSAEAAAKAVAAVAWPMERRENRDAWAPKMLDPGCAFRDETIERARWRLASAVAAVLAASPVCRATPDDGVERPRLEPLPDPVVPDIREDRA